MIFPEFALEHIEVEPGISIRVRHGGQGPAVVLLHGHPRTHTTWHAVAPLLAHRFTVVCPDLRGYGGSSKPAPDAEHRRYSDRAMAGDVVRVMATLGHHRFAVVGHDRGSYVAYRMALDHPEVVTRLVVLDSVPILEALERADATFAQKWWHWFFFSSPHAERVINADPLAWYRPDIERMGVDNYHDMVSAISDPDTVRAMVEDYRASLHIDRIADGRDRDAGRRITCPVLVGWSSQDDMEDLYGDPAAIWGPWCQDPPAHTVIDSGHHMAEDNPTQLSATLNNFLTVAAG